MLNPILIKKHEHEDELDLWIAQNKTDLIACFIDEFNSEWRAFVKEKFNEVNAE
jgi:dsDNA-binding SOS-regulon protein